MTSSWLVPAGAASLWGFLSTLLLLQSWAAGANLLIALIGLARGRMKPSRVFELVLGALIGGAIYSALLRLGFWFLLEVRGYGRNWLERGIYLGCLALAARFLLPRLTVRVRKLWREAMGEGSAEEGTAKEAP